MAIDPSCGKEAATCADGIATSLVLAAAAARDGADQLGIARDGVLALVTTARAEGYSVGDRTNLEALALRFHQEWLQNDLAATGIEVARGFVGEQERRFEE